jgi:hypothetical protein
VHQLLDAVRIKFRKLTLETGDDVLDRCRLIDLSLRRGTVLVADRQRATSLATQERARQHPCA